MDALYGFDAPCSEQKKSMALKYSFKEIHCAGINQPHRYWKRFLQLHGIDDVTHCSPCYDEAIWNCSTYVDSFLHDNTYRLTVFPSVLPL